MSSDSFRIDSDILTRSRVFSAISKLSRGCQYLPHTYWIDAATITLDNEPHAVGTFAEVYRGTRNGEPVAVKVLRTSNQESRTRLMKVSTGVDRKLNTWTRADTMRYSAYARRRSCGNTWRVRTFSCSTAYFTVMMCRRSSHLGCLTGISPNI